MAVWCSGAEARQEGDLTGASCLIQQAQSNEGKREGWDSSHVLLEIINVNVQQPGDSMCDGYI